MSVQVGEVLEGKVTDIMNYGVFVKLNDGKIGLVHISEVSRDYVEDIHSVLKSGDDVKVKVISMDEKGKMRLSIKKALPMPERKNKEQRNNKREKEENTDETPESKLDNMLSKFLKDSDEKQLYLKKNFESKRGYSKRR